MQRILDPAQIEAFATTSVPRIRLPDPASLFARRGQRLRTLAEGHWSRGTGAAVAVTSPAGSGDVPSGDRAVSEGTPSGGDSLGDYLRLMAVVTDGQQVELDALRAALVEERFAQ